jgi:hypothetical protein
MSKPLVDLGREGGVVTWNTWIGRTGEAALKCVDEEERERLRLIVALRDGRRMRVHKTEMHTHDPGEESPVNFITGYVFVGQYVGDAGEHMVSLGVTPDLISTVEWVALPPEEGAPFGFAPKDGERDTVTELRDGREIHGAVSLIQSNELE